MRLLKILILISILVLTVSFCFLYGERPVQLLGISLLVFFILSSFFITDKFVFFEPITLFNFFNLLGALGLFYYYHEGFYRSKYILHTEFSQDLDSLFTKSVYIFLVGYVMSLIGYYSIRKKIDFKFTVIIRDYRVYKLLIRSFLTLCYLNFIYIVLMFAGGNVMVYFQNIAVRQHEFTQGGSTIFYNLGYIAIYLWQFLDFKQKNNRWWFALNFIVVFSIKFSTGRIVQTLFFLISVIAIEYFLRYDFYKQHTKKILSTFSILGSFAFFMYFYRLYSSVVFINQADTNFFGFLRKKLDYMEFSESLIEKGNIPNIPILMKIIDSWESDVGFLYGKSLVMWVLNFLPMAKTGLLPPSEVIKEVWYPNIEGGALPPTGYGELYANFGLFGVFFGMFAFGLLMAHTYNMLRKYNNMWYLLIFINLSVFFFSVYPKGEFDNMSLYLFLPYVFTYICILFLNQLFSKNKNS